MAENIEEQSKFDANELKYRNLIINRLNSFNPDIFKTEELELKSTVYLEAAKKSLESIIAKQNADKSAFFQGKVNGSLENPAEAQNKLERKKNKAEKKFNGTILSAWDRRFRPNSSVNCEESGTSKFGGVPLRLYVGPNDKIGRLI